MDMNAYLGVIEDILRDRQHAIVDRIIQLYEIDDATHTQLRKMIQYRTLLDNASTTKVKAVRIKSDALHDDMQIVPLRS